MVQRESCQPAFRRPLRPGGSRCRVQIEDHETAEEIFESYRAACAQSREALGAVDLDDMIQYPKRSKDYNVRWIVVHMLEETARHAGHADIIREQLDGRTGAGYDPR